MVLSRHGPFMCVVCVVLIKDDHVMTGICRNMWLGCGCFGYRILSWHGRYHELALDFLLQTMALLLFMD